MKSDSTQDPEPQSDAPSVDAAKSVRSLSAIGYVGVFAIGVYLGVLFVKSEVASWERVHKMFLFQEPHMYLIISIAILVAMVSMLLIKGLQIKTVEGAPIKYVPKPYHKGVVIGSIMFGAGWAISGACPGPIYAQIGAGQWNALWTLLGAMLGMYAYAALKPKLPH